MVQDGGVHSAKRIVLKAQAVRVAPGDVRIPLSRIEVKADRQRARAHALQRPNLASEPSADAQAGRRDPVAHSRKAPAQLPPNLLVSLIGQPAAHFAKLQRLRALVRLALDIAIGHHYGPFGGLCSTGFARHTFEAIDRVEQLAVLVSAETLYLLLNFSRAAEDAQEEWHGGHWADAYAMVVASAGRSGSPTVHWYVCD